MWPSRPEGLPGISGWRRWQQPPLGCSLLMNRTYLFLHKLICFVSSFSPKDTIKVQIEVHFRLKYFQNQLKLPLHQPIQISFSSGSVVPNMRLTKKLFYQGKQTRLSSASEFGLPCLLSTNPAVIFDCLVCLVCCQPIPPSYLTAWSVLLLPTVIFDRSICLVCYPPISPNYHHCFQKR